MRLIRDGIFKRNVFGYLEHTRIQLYVTHIRQIPMYVVYPVHNDDTELASVQQYGHWFINAENVTKFVKDYVFAWQANTEALPSVDLTEELLDALRKPFEFTDRMYRVVLRDPLGDFPLMAMGSWPRDPHQPWFTCATSQHTAKHNLYSRAVATSIAALHATMSYEGYVRDHLSHTQEGAYFAVESATYHPSGIPQDGDQWVEEETYPAWNRSITVNFSDDMTEIRYKYIMPSGQAYNAVPDMLEAVIVYDAELKQRSN